MRLDVKALSNQVSAMAEPTRNRQSRIESLSKFHPAASSRQKDQA